jgi:anti-anti-sigma regulatory factor
MDIKTEKDGAKLIISFVGEIDEDAKFDSFGSVNFDGLTTVIFDLENVTLLNSCGLRTWISWVKTFPSEIITVFRRCPQMIVEQMSILDGFVPKNSMFESFYVPYYCDDCDEEADWLAIRGEDFVAGTTDFKYSVSIKDDVLCPSCKKEMELDILPEKYFKFLRYK